MRMAMNINGRNMFRYGCITILVLILVGFAFEHCSRSRTAAAQEPVQQLGPRFSKYCSCARKECIENHPRNLYTQIKVAGSGDINALATSLSLVATIEPFDSNGCYLDEIGNFQVALLEDGAEETNLSFALHTITDNGFQIV